MRIVEAKSLVLKKEDFEKKLGIKVDKIILPENDEFLKLYAGKYKVYLRCEDVRRLFNLDFNIFAEDIKLTKEGISIRDGEEVYKGKAKHFSKIFKK